MSDRHRNSNGRFKLVNGAYRRTNSLVASGSLTAATRILSPGDNIHLYDEAWKHDAWNFYDANGEFWYGTTWLATGISKMRLFAAMTMPGGEEPEAVTEGPIVDLVSSLSGGIGGQTALLKSLAVKLSVPGEGFLVVEDINGVYEVSAKSADEIRARRGGGNDGGFEIQEDVQKWRILGTESLVSRIYCPHERYSWLSTSPARPALPPLREIDLYNRHIIATLISRVASNGLLLYPSEATFAVREEFKDAADPFIAELVEIASQSIQNPGAASAAIPMPIKVPAELIDKFKHLTFATVLDEHIFEARVQALGRLATTLNIPVEVLKGMGDVNHWCVDETTQILTRNGWMHYNEVSSGDEVYTLNHKTGLAEWQPIGEVKSWNVNDLDMVSIEGRYHSSLTTPNHRWPVLRGHEAAYRARVFTTSDAIGPNDFLVTAALSSEVPTEAKYSDAFVELMAWYFTEGTCHVREGRDIPRVYLFQSNRVNADNVARIHRALTNLYGPITEGWLDTGGRRATDETVERRHAEAQMRASGMSVSAIADHFGISKVQVYKDLRIVNGEISPREKVTIPKWTMVTDDDGMSVFRLNSIAGQPFVEMAPERIVPLHFIYSLTATQLDLFIDTAIRGDGSIMGGATKILGQKDPRMLEAFELAAILSGRSVTNRSNVGGSFKPGIQHHISVRENMVFGPRNGFSARPNNMTTKKYTGVIWCPTTPNKTWLAKRNGSVFFTGNTSFQIGEDAIKMHLSPLTELICNGLTRSYLHPLLESAGMSTIAPNGGQYVIWYDPTELTARPDHSESAVTLYDRMELSGTALRRENGFEEADAPTKDELKVIALKKLLTVSTLSGSVYEALTGEPLGMADNGTDTGNPDTGVGDQTPSTPELPIEDQPIGTVPGTQNDTPPTSQDPTAPHAISSYMTLSHRNGGVANGTRARAISQ